MKHLLSTSTQQISLFLLSCLTITMVVVRLIHLSSIPAGFFVDESSIAYNAYSILLTGKDEHGSSWPVFFEAFGEYKNPVYIYSAVPFIKVFGLSIFASRFTSAIWGLIAGLVMYKLAKIITNNATVSVCASLLLLTNPAHLVLSRISFEIISFFPVLLCSILTLYNFSVTLKAKWFYWFSWSLALMVYTYTSARFLSVILFILAILIFRTKFSWRMLVIGITIMVIGLLPLLVWEWQHPGSLRARYDIVSVFSYQQGIEAWSSIIVNYLKHLTPSFLFDIGDGNLRHSLGKHAVFLWVTIPLFIVGLWQMGKDTTLSRQFIVWLLAGLLISPIPAAVTIQAPHILRSVSLVVFVITVSIWGLQFINNHKYLAILIGCLCVESIIIVNYLLATYPSRSGPWFEDNTVQALNIASKLPGPYYLSEKLYPGTDITWAFIRKFPPDMYQLFGMTDTYQLNFAKTNGINSGVLVLDRNLCDGFLSGSSQWFRIEFISDTCVIRVTK